MKIQRKLGMSFALLAVAAMGLALGLLYWNTSGHIREDVRDRLHDAVGVAAMLVDAETHAALREPSQEGGPGYMRIKRRLQQIRDAGTDIRFVYTMREGPKGEIVFIVDAETDPEEIAHLCDIYDDASPLLKSRFATLDRVMVEENFYTDKWGTWLTGYAPFYGPGGRREGVLGMDISYGKVLSYQHRFLGIGLIVLGVAVLFVAALGWFVGIRLAAPIVALTRCADRISEGDLDVRIDVKGNDETGRLARSFAFMISRLNRLLESLRAEIAERKAAEVQLQQAKMEAEFYLDLMSHDLTNFNHAILGNLYLLEKRAELDEKQKKHMETCKRQVSKTDNLISKVRAFAAAKRIDPETRRPIELNACIRDLIPIVKNLHSNKNVEIEFDSEGEKYAIATDLIESVLMNVMENTVKHSPEGNVWVGVSVADDGEVPPGFWEIRIEDRGCGVPDEMKEKIFDRYIRIGEEKGMGIGLSLAKMIVEQLGGSVRVEDRVKGDHARGSVFRIRIPKG